MESISKVGKIIEKFKNEYDYKMKRINLKYSTKDSMLEEYIIILYMMTKIDKEETQKKKSIKKLYSSMEKIKKQIKNEKKIHKRSQLVDNLKKCKEFFIFKEDNITEIKNE